MNRTYARRKIKAEASRLLAGNWLKTFLIITIQLFLTMIVARLLPLRTPLVEEIINAGNDGIALLKLFLPKVFTAKTAVSLIVTILLYLFVMSPFSIGVCRFFLEVAKGHRPKISVVFSVYASLKTVFSSVWLTLLVFFISSFWSVVFMLIPIALIVLGIIANSRVISFFATLLVSVAFVFALLWNSRYAFASYIFAEGKNGAFSSLRECIELMRGRTKECIMLRLSYFIWDFFSTYMFPYYVYFALSGTVYASFLFYLRGDAQVSGEDATAEL